MSHDEHDLEGASPLQVATLEANNTHRQVHEGLIVFDRSVWTPEDRGPLPMLIEGLLYEGQSHLFYGASGDGKSFIAMWIAYEVMKQGLKVVYLDREMGSRRVNKRLFELGFERDVLKGCFLYAPFEKLTPKNVRRLERTLLKHKPSLVIFDSLIDFLSIAGLSESSNDEVAYWLNTMLEPMKKLEIASLLLDHVGGDVSKGPRGATVKKDYCDVIAFVKKKKDFDPHTVGEVSITFPTVSKDRDSQMYPTNLFEIGGDGNGTIVLERMEDSFSTTSSERIDSSTDEEIVEKVFQALVEGSKTSPGGWVTSTNWKEGCKNKGIRRNQDFQDARKFLLGEEASRIEQNPTTKKYRPQGTPQETQGGPEVQDIHGGLHGDYGPDTGPLSPDDKSGSYTGGPEVQGSPEPLRTLGPRVGSTRSLPLKGGPVDPRTSVDPEDSPETSTSGDVPESTPGNFTGGPATSGDTLDNRACALVERYGNNPYRERWKELLLNIPSDPDSRHHDDDPTAPPGVVPPGLDDPTPDKLDSPDNPSRKYVDRSLFERAPLPPLKIEPERPTFEYNSDEPVDPDDTYEPDDPEEEEYLEEDTDDTEDDLWAELDRIIAEKAQRGE